MENDRTSLHSLSRPLPHTALTNTLYWVASLRPVSVALVPVADTVAIVLGSVPVP